MLCRPERTQKVTKGMVTKMPTQHSQAKKAAAELVQLTKLSMRPSFLRMTFSEP